MSFTLCEWTMHGIEYKNFGMFSHWHEYWRIISARTNQECTYDPVKGLVLERLNAFKSLPHAANSIVRPDTGKAGKLPALMVKKLAVGAAGPPFWTGASIGGGCTAGAVARAMGAAPSAVGSAFAPEGSTSTAEGTFSGAEGSMLPGGIIPTAPWVSAARVGGSVPVAGVSVAPAGGSAAGAGGSAAGAETGAAVVGAGVSAAGAGGSAAWAGVSLGAPVGRSCLCSEVFLPAGSVLWFTRSTPGMRKSSASAHVHESRFHCHENSTRPPWCLLVEMADLLILEGHSRTE